MASTETQHGGKTTGHYVVLLKASASKTAHLDWFNSVQSGKSTITHPEWPSELFHGYAGRFDQTTLKRLRSSPDVAIIEEDGIVRAAGINIQNNATWNLARLGQDARLSGGEGDVGRIYSYDSTGGAGVDVYVLDTGIKTDHNEFGGRATLGAVFAGDKNVDGSGHGTAVAAVIAGTTCGVAKSANLIAVKVLADDDTGTVSDVISGIVWVTEQVIGTVPNRPSVINMSFTMDSRSSVLDYAVGLAVTSNNIHVTVAAGDGNVDVSTISPADILVVNTVGASAFDDTMWTKSNFGGGVDLFAPGVNITSAAITSTSAFDIFTGTSMAAAHGAGLIAYLIGVYGNVDPATMSTWLKVLARKGRLSSISTGTNNFLARNDI